MHKVYVSLVCLLAVGCGGNRGFTGGNSAALAGTTDGEDGGFNGGSGGSGAGGTAVGDPTVGKTLSYYRDLKPVIDAKCGNCHAAGAIGPFTLSSYADVQAHADAIAQAVAGNTMPPWQPDDSCNSYYGDISLSPAQKAALLDWLAAQAPMGSPSDVPVALPAAEAYPALRADLTLKMPAAYQIQQGPDEYRCFAIPWPETKTVYVQGFGIRPGNLSVVHHAIIDIVAPAQAAQVAAQDGKDGHPGWACSQAGASLNWLGAWAPGVGAAPFSKDGSLGTRVDPGTLLVLQMHYHSYTPASAAPDLSSIDLQLADTVSKPGQMYPMINVAWVAGFGMNIPAGAPDATATWTTSAASYTGGVGHAIYSVAVHAHVRASVGNITLTHNGKDQCLLHIPQYNFHWQNGYLLKQPPVVAAGDTVTLNCHWNNSAANQPLGASGQKMTPANIKWGEGTNDEMCLGILYGAPP